MVSFPFSSARSCFWRTSSSFFACIPARSASSGSMISVPLCPSTIAVLPFHSSLTGIPTRAGIPMVRAKIAVWELEEPSVVTKASRLSLSICTVSLGARSSAMIITGSMISCLSVCPIRMRIRRSEISLTSAARPCIYSSSIEANNREKLSPVLATANSAFTCWERMIW